MNYKYYTHSTDLKELNHIEWFVLHEDEYFFQGEEAKIILSRLKNNIRKKNIFYSDIVRDYEALVVAFNNDPYEYAFDLSGKSSSKAVSSDRIINYFVEVSDSEGTSCMVPYGYVAEKGMDRYPKTAEQFVSAVKASQYRAINTFQAIEEHYLRYWKDGGVKDAISRFEGVHFGKDYHLIKTSVFYLFYNIVLMILLRETRFFSVVMHFWQYFSHKPTAQYSAMYLFGGHIWIGLLILVRTAYYLFYDIIYSYGLYYLVFVLNKYSNVKKYHDGVLQLYVPFKDDYVKCRRGITSSLIEKTRNRDKIYIPLIMKAAIKYDFMINEESFINNDNRSGEEVKKVPQPVLVPVARYYKKPVGKTLIRMMLLWLIARIFCNYSNLLLF